MMTVRIHTGSLILLTYAHCVSEAVVTAGLNASCTAAKEPDSIISF